MSSKEWAGFTDEEIQRMQSNPSKISSFCNDSSCDIDGSCPHRQNRRPMKIKNPLKRIMQIETENSLSDISEENREKIVTNKITNQPFIKCNTIAVEGEKKNGILEKDIKKNTESNTFNQSFCQQNGQNGLELQKALNTSNETLQDKESNSESSKMCKNNMEPNTNLPVLEAFEQRQTRIKAENARRKSLIVKTIMDKKKRTQAEAVKLVKIQKDLNHLDSILSSDVSILRNCIERASVEFSEAEKRYLKAEKEFVEAKLLLFDKMQRKEQLTEHLCTIIEQNENRKANKLVELMKQLEMESVNDDDCEENKIEPILSNLCTMNDEAYLSCQTIKLQQPKIEKQIILSTKEPELEENRNSESSVNFTRIIEKQDELETHCKECDFLLMSPDKLRKNSNELEVTENDNPSDCEMLNS